MSAKKSIKSSIPDSIPLTEEQKKLPEVKALLKKLKEEQEKAEASKKIQPIVDFASKTLGESFKNFSAVASYVNKLTGETGRAKRITDEVKTKIDALIGEGKKDGDIAKALKLTYPQVYNYRKKKAKSK